MDVFKYTFNEDEWQIYIIEDKDEVIEDLESDALTKFDECELYFRRGAISRRNVIHEIFHVYFSYCYLGTTNNINVYDFEEIAAELISHKYDRIGKVADEVYNKLCQLRDKKVEKK